MKQLTTTSYAILALLALRPWSAYELSKQMRRNVGEYWPRAERGIYDEPRNLVAHGLAEASTRHRGQRARTEYAITEEGRVSLREWLALPSQPPQFESEAMLRIAFAEHGDPRAALATLSGLRAQAAERRDLIRLVAREYVEGRGTYPERLPVIGVVIPFFADYFELLERWSTWAGEQVESWSTEGPGPADHGNALVALQRVGALSPIAVPD